MANYKVKSPLNFYKVGDIVTEKEVSRYGPQYFEPIGDNKMMEPSNIITKDNVIEKETKVTETPEAPADDESPAEETKVTDKPKKKK